MNLSQAATNGFGVLALAEAVHDEAGFADARGQAGEVTVARDDAGIHPSRPVYNRSIASMIIAASVLFLPLV